LLRFDGAGEGVRNSKFYAGFRDRPLYKPPRAFWLNLDEYRQMKLGNEIKVVWIVSAPRCGSMWVFNVTRQIVRAAGFEVLPTLVTQSDEATLAAAGEAGRDPAMDRVRVLKLHGLCPDFPFARFIAPRRDIRDSVVSFMRFMHCDFETALSECAIPAIRINRYYDAVTPDRKLIIDYGAIIARPGQTAHMIARFLQAPVPWQTTDEIARHLSKEKVSRLIEQKEEDLNRRSREGRPVAQDELVVLGPGNTRAFDIETGFQSGHVSDYQEGNWKSVLTAQQKSRLETIIDELAGPV
jgi:sulfotransferase family protein